MLVSGFPTGTEHYPLPGPESTVAPGAYAVRGCLNHPMPHESHSNASASA